MEHIRQKLEEFSNLANKLQEYLKTAPKEKLRTRKKGNHYQYYSEKDKKRNYISKKNIEIAKRIARRDYYQKLLPQLLKNIITMHQFITNYQSVKLEDCFLNLSDARKQLVEPLFIDNETYAAQWQAKNYERKKDIPDGSLLTQKNEPVRSKSEIIIADLLNLKKVPYHYEYPVKLSNGNTIYPDFFCLNKRTRKEFYWEHFGKMDDPIYSSNMTQRISDYSKIGIIPGENLILTFETARTHLETKVIESLIKSFLM